MARPIHLRLPLVSWVAAAVEIFAFVATAFLPAHGPGRDPTDVIAVACVAATVAGLLLVARLPYVGVGLVLVGMAVYAAQDYASGPVYLALPFAVFLAALRLRWQAAVGVAVVFVVVMGTVHVTLNGFSGLGEIGGVLTWAALAVLGAQVVRGRRRRILDERRREAEQAERTRVEERVRIAQDLHDGVAHALSVVSIQARVARKDVPDGSRAAEAVDVIVETAAAALADVGSVLERLRDQDAPLRPQSTVDQVADLVDQARRAGQDVAYAERLVDQHPPSVQTAAVRIVQEALTNARRHAPSSPVTVEVDDDAGLRVAVVNRLPERPLPSDGHGLGVVGMRERVDATGGRITVGAHDGIWEVEARWPRRA